MNRPPPQPAAARPGTPRLARLEDDGGLLAVTVGPMLTAVANTVPLERRSLVLALLAVAHPAVAAPRPLALPIRVENLSPASRPRAAVTVGVPFPRGRLRSLRSLAREDGHLLQASALERWPDGSVRWALLDFTAPLPPRGSQTVAIVSRSKPAPNEGRGPEARTTVSESPTGVVLDSGRLRLEVARDAPVLARRIVLDGKPLGVEVAIPELETTDGPAPALPPERIAVEASGPVRAEVVVGGRYRGGLAYEVRIATFAGTARLRILYTLTNLADPLYTRLRRVTIAVPFHVKRFRLGVDGREIRGRARHRERVLLQETDSRLLLDRDEVGHRGGWALASGPELTLGIAARFFAEEYPKALRISAAGLAYDLWPARARPCRFGSGAAKTHELWLVFAREDRSAPTPDRLAALATPPVASVAPGWIAHSGALPGSVDGADPVARPFLAAFAEAFAAYERRVARERWDDSGAITCTDTDLQVPRTGYYGMLNWGDWNFPGYRDRTEGCDGWGNLEYDLPQVLALAFAATGEPRYFAAMEAAARHYRDVDIIHHAPGHPGWVGMNHPHKPLHFSFAAREKIDLGHTWTEGLVTYHRFTGDVRALEAARGIADFLARNLRKAGNPRQFGWPMIALVAVADATGEQRYLDAARAYAIRAMQTFPPDPDSGDWKLGVLADGLAAVHAAIGDREVRRWLIAYADALISENKHDLRYYAPLGYVYRLTGREPYRRAALAALRRSHIGNWGKVLAKTGRLIFRILSYLPADKGLTRRH